MFNSGQISAPNTAFFQDDFSKFDLDSISTLQHRFSEHPLLSLDAIKVLAKRLEARGMFRSSHANVPKSANFQKVVRENRIQMPLQETLDQINDLCAFVSLSRVDLDPEYKVLMQQFKTEVLHSLQLDPNDLWELGNWIFIASPGYTTPYHRDRESNFLLHIQGSKRLYVWSPNDREVVSAKENERFIGEGNLDRTHYREELIDRARRFDLQPGQGVFMPFTAPHMVEGSNEVTITMSFNFVTPQGMRERRLYKANAKLRSLGLNPVEPGQRVWRDWIIEKSINSVQHAKRLLKKKPDRDVLDKYN